VTSSQLERGRSAKDGHLEYRVMVLVKATRSFIFFLSVTALICFVLDHLLCPAQAMGVVANCRRRHGGWWRMGARTAWDELVRKRSRAARGRRIRLRIAMADGQFGK
jgi:hypothetical protein